MARLHGLNIIFGSMVSSKPEELLTDLPAPEFPSFEEFLESLVTGSAIH